ncbi:MAG: hypothetical protein JNL21_12350 [Myxococcales bacterium]|nr:hypothetical protein [Myxococcales bacterium]
MSRSNAVAAFVLLSSLGCSRRSEPAAEPAGPGTPLPPEIARTIEDSCLSCHGDPPTSSAPQSLASVEAWRAPSLSDPAKTNGEMALERMKDGLRPMPPMGAVGATELDAIEAWVAAGMPDGKQALP